MEQVGKQDFEIALTRHGLCHEDFMLRVHRPRGTAHDDESNQDCTVTIVAVKPGRRQLYTGGPRHNWVRQFAIDLRAGA